MSKRLDCPCLRLRRWARAELRRRAKAVRDGTAPIDWTHPEHRLLWSEVVARGRDLNLDMSRDPVAWRLWWNGAGQCPSCDHNVLR